MAGFDALLMPSFCLLLASLVAGLLAASYTFIPSAIREQITLKPSRKYACVSRERSRLEHAAMVEVGVLPESFLSGNLHSPSPNPL
jgi:hypothetical protein